MPRRFEHLSADERTTLASMRQQNKSLREIGRLLRRSPSTLSREITRNRGSDGYASGPAQLSARQRRKDSRPPRKLAEGGTAWLLVTTLLSWCWSPRQISKALRRKWPEDTSMWAVAGSVDTDLSFLSLLELYGTEIAERRMPVRRVVEALDVIEHI